ncbi:hypothetical protein KC19_VG322800 [Ceratodon purpureus]|uniref:Uncharacterized protein n=1 Tax=Ceratodon purpureus TaxID=3225 RepID=A0A8T0HXR0_CERPU|nr:hypothetical protein KC19_VG322800 [Ceratodon purpureus]
MHGKTVEREKTATVEAEAGGPQIAAAQNDGAGAMHNVADPGLRTRTLDDSAVQALILLRDKVTGVVHHKRMRIQALRHNAGRSVAVIRTRLAEERERLKFVKRNMVEKSALHERAATEYRLAREVLVQAKIDEGTTALKDRRLARKFFRKGCENLVESWIENVAVADARLKA